MVQASRIHGHEIHVVSYALLDGGDCQYIKAGYVVYILMRPSPLISQCFRGVPDA